MQQRQFKITIAAPRETVWNRLWDDASYREWTSVFAPGSRAETDWQKGSKVRFLDGNNDGMLSLIVDNQPNKFMAIKHVGMIKNGKEIQGSSETKEWEGSENYTLQDIGGKTELTVDLELGNVGEEMMNYFESTFPKALGRLKEISEKREAMTI
jgi:hypothetical protein